MTTKEQLQALKNPILERYLNKCKHTNHTKHFRQTRYDSVYFMKCKDCNESTII